MSLPISIESLMARHRVESNRVEFKESWNPVTMSAITRTICAFANDFDNIGGGYIIIGAAEKDGVLVRPVKGVNENQIDSIQKKILTCCRFISPAYLPRVYVETIESVYVLVLWVPSGDSRPYNVYQNVGLKKELRGERKFYIRNASITEEASGERLTELMALKNRTPFDERGNPQIKPEDISMALLRDHLVKVGSRLTVVNQKVEDILESMDLMTGSTECRRIKNVAAMMFCDHPEKFFPYTQAEIVIFPEGREKNPSNLIEVPPIIGPIPTIIAKTLDYLKTHIITEHIKKVSYQAEALRTYNYPYAALEEAVVNAFYHRDYTVHEPVEISVEPECIRILSFSGPDRSISMNDLLKADSLYSRRYRNRRLGEFLKELDLTEGRSTGIPTIQGALKKNGSSRAIIVTDDERTSFRIDIPNATYVPSPQDDPYLPILHRFFQRALSLGKTTVKMPGEEHMLLMIRTLQMAMTPTSMGDIAVGLELSPNTVRRSIIAPLLEIGLLEMSIPDRPNSSKQRYIATIAATMFLPVKM